jgi:hypothetical protein
VLASTLHEDQSEFIRRNFVSLFWESVYPIIFWCNSKFGEQICNFKNLNYCLQIRISGVPDILCFLRILVTALQWCAIRTAYRLYRLALKNLLVSQVPLWITFLVIKHAFWEGESKFLNTHYMNFSNKSLYNLKFLDTRGLEWIILH